MEETVKRLAKEYRVGAVLYDRHQAEGLTQGLDRAGVPVEEFVFSASSVNNLARSLFIARRDRALEMPDDEELRTQFVETNTGVKLSNPVGAHDDIPTIVGMLHLALAQRGGGGFASITVPRSSIVVKRATQQADRRELARTVALRGIARGERRPGSLGHRP